MKIRNKIFAGLAVSALALTSLTATPAHAQGTTPLSEVLNIANPAFDKNSDDFDILTAAINAVLAEKPTSAVSVLANGSMKLTAFIPTDMAFRKLASKLGKGTLNKEENVFAAIASLGINKVEKVLLYHVVLGDPLTRAQLIALPNLSEFTTAQGSKVTLNVAVSLVLRDLSPLPNPRVIINRANINDGNNQVAHAINKVLLPNLG